MDRCEPKEVVSSTCGIEGRTAWAKPELKRLAAGSAEDGDGMVNDFGFDPS